MAGNTVKWYYHNPEGWTFFHSIRTFLFKHIGSVIGGAAINGLFLAGDYFFDMIKPGKTIDQEGTVIHLYDKVCLPLERLFSLVRSDVMVYIQLSGNPYCNSAMYAEYFSKRTLAISSIKSSSRIYRICSHFFLAFLNAWINCYLLGSFSTILILATMGFNMIISTYFISLHCDIADAILICFAQEEELQKRKAE